MRSQLGGWRGFIQQATDRWGVFSETSVAMVIKSVVATDCLSITVNCLQTKRRMFFLLSQIGGPTAPLWKHIKPVIDAAWIQKKKRIRQIVLTCSAVSPNADSAHLSTSSFSSKRKQQNKKLPLFLRTDSLKVKKKKRFNWGGVLTSWDGRAPPVVTESSEGKRSNDVRV